MQVLLSDLYTPMNRGQITVQQTAREVLTSTR